MKKKQMTEKKKIAWKTKVLGLLFLPLIGSGCSYHDKQFSYFNMLDAEKGTRQNKEAAQKFWSSVRPMSNLSASHYKLGRYYQQQGKHQQAIAEFTKAIDNDRGYCKAYNAIAMSHDALKHCELAYKSYEQARQCDPQEAYIYNNYGCSSLLCGNYEHGLELLRKAAQLSQDNLRIKNNIKLAQMFTEREIKPEQQPAQEASEALAMTPSMPPAEEAVTTEPAVSLVTEPANTAFETAPSEAAATVIADIPVSDIAETGTEAPLQTEVLEPITLHREQSKTIPPLPAVETEQINQVTAQKLPSSVQNSIMIGNLVIQETSETNEKAAASNETQKVIEVSNGNGITGMAGKSANYFRDHGFIVGRLTNAKDFHFQESIIYYKEGYFEVAKELARITPGMQNMEKVDSFGRPSIGVRILLGRDLVNAQFPDKLPREYHYALSESAPHIDSLSKAGMLTASY